MASGITVQHVTGPEELEKYREVQSAAFGPSELLALVWPVGPEGPSAEAKEASRKSLEDNWRNDPSTNLLTAKLPSGKIVGIAKWNFYSDTGAHTSYPRTFPPGGNAELGVWFFSTLEDARNEALVGKKHALMAVLAVDPEHQRMGIGQKLLDWGLAKCDEEGFECWIDASKFGKGLYEKCGWEFVKDIDIDVGKWGGPEGKVNTTTCMIRHPRTVKENS